MLGFVKDAYLFFYFFHFFFGIVAGHEGLWVIDTVFWFSALRLRDIFEWRSAGPGIGIGFVLYLHLHGPCAFMRVLAMAT